MDQKRLFHLLIPAFLQLQAHHLSYQWLKSFGESSLQTLDEYSKVNC